MLGPRLYRPITLVSVLIPVLLLVPQASDAAGSVLSQGDVLLRADLARSSFGVTGATTRIGVISAGILGLDQAKSTGDLPSTTCGPQAGGVTSIDPNLCRAIGGSLTDNAEGTALMEIIHDLAPGAELLFCAPATNLDLVACIQFLASKVDVIIDDFIAPGEPYFEDGPIATAAAAAVAAGVVYVTAAGNEAQQHYQGTYVNSGDGVNSHQIAPGNTSFNVTGTTVVVFLQWSNPFGAAGDDYDLCFTGESPAECAPFNTKQGGSEDPIEAQAFGCPSGCSLQVRRVSGSAQTIELFVFDGPLAAADRVAADSVVGHAARQDVLAVGAINASDPGTDTVASYSSRGPSTVVFPSPETRQKPNAVAVDGVSVTGAGGFPTNLFGTSAAAPHAAAIAALMLEAKPTLTPGAVRSILEQTAVAVGEPIRNSDSGYGRLDAFAAVSAALSLSLTDLAVTPTSPQTLGSTMTFTATAGGGIPPLQYKWWLNNGTGWNVGAEWSPNPSFNWTPTAPGSYEIGVWARSSGNTVDYPENRAIRTVPFVITGTKAELTSPTPGSTLPGSTVTFAWTAGSGVLEYWLEIGTTPGNGDVYTASQGTALSRTVSTLPTTGATLYVRLWSRFPAGWQPNAYTYTAAPMNVSGVWSGAFSTSLVSGMISFTIEQSGVNLSGSFSVSATSGSGAGT